MTEPEKLDLASHEIAEDKKQELLRLFPEIRTEGGKLDFERLKLALGETVDTGKERYGMNWPGKADCFKTIQQTSLATLRPCPEESVNFDTSENLIIEGDNLEVLKLLQKSYLGKVKMIYIDPPYNTGNDFIYPDNYSESLQTYLEYTGQVDDEGRKFGTNTDADGRFHSKWLNMMYPRLYLARNLLQEDGVLFVSCDDHESDNLRKIGNDTGQPGYPTIAAITKERVRRVIKRLDAQDAENLDLEGGIKQDRGFRVFKLAESNFKSWNADLTHEVKALEKQLELHVDHIREARTDGDLLYEILLKSGFPITTPVETLTFAGKAVYSVAGGALFICLERELTLELIRAMAEKKPERVVCLDEGFAANDQLKANAVQIFKTKGANFKTV